MPTFEFIPGARYWVGEFFGYLLSAQMAAAEPQFAEKPHITGHFSNAVDVLTLPSSLHEGRTFQVLVWKPYAGNGTYSTYGLSDPFIQTNQGYFCVMPEDEQKNIRDTIAKTIPAILTYPGGGYASAPDCQPILRNGKFLWGDKIGVKTADYELTNEVRRILTAVRNRASAKSTKGINTKLSTAFIEIVMLDFFESQKYAVEQAPQNKSGYKSAITLIFDQSPPRACNTA